MGELNPGENRSTSPAVETGLIAPVVCGGATQRNPLPSKVMPAPLHLWRVQVFGRFVHWGYSRPFYLGAVRLPGKMQVSRPRRKQDNRPSENRANCPGEYHEGSIHCR